VLLFKIALHVVVAKFWEASNPQSQVFVIEGRDDGCPLFQGVQRTCEIANRAETSYCINDAPLTCWLSHNEVSGVHARKENRGNHFFLYDIVFEKPPPASAVIVHQGSCASTQVGPLIHALRCASSSTISEQGGAMLLASSSLV